MWVGLLYSLQGTPSLAMMFSLVATVNNQYPFSVISPNGLSENRTDFLKPRSKNIQRTEFLYGTRIGTQSFFTCTYSPGIANKFTFGLVTTSPFFLYIAEIPDKLHLCLNYLSLCTSLDSR